MIKPHKCLACEISMICEGRLCFICQEKHPNAVEKAIKQLEVEDKAEKKRRIAEVKKVAKKLLEQGALRKYQKEMLKSV